jgi:PAS domain-containing protein
VAAVRAQETGVRLTVLRRLHELIGRVSAGRSLEETLQAVVDGVVEGVGFGVAAVNYVHPDGVFETVAVAGSDEARSKLLGHRYQPHRFDVELERAVRWGALHFVPHDRFGADEPLDGWVPEMTVVDAPDAWHPLDALFVPLRAPSGDVVGMLSVDVPEDGLRPGPTRRELLEMFAAQAGIAIDNARLTERLRLEQDRLRASEQSFRLAFDGAGVGMTMVGLTGDERGRYLRVNPAMCRITGYSERELVGRTFAEITHGDDVEASIAAMERALAVTPASTARRSATSEATDPSCGPRSTPRSSVTPPARRSTPSARSRTSARARPPTSSWSIAPSTTR